MPEVLGSMPCGVGELLKTLTRVPQESTQLIAFQTFLEQREEMPRLHNAIVLKRLELSDIEGLGQCQVVHCPRMVGKSRRLRESRPSRVLRVLQDVYTCIVSAHVGPIPTSFRSHKHPVCRALSGAPSCTLACQRENRLTLLITLRLEIEIRRLSLLSKEIRQKSNLSTLICSRLSHSHYPSPLLCTSAKR